MFINKGVYYSEIYHYPKIMDKKTHEKPWV